MLNGEKVSALEVVDVRGYLSDFVVALTLVGVCLVAYGWSRRRLMRAGLAAVAFAWGFLNVANYEHVKALDAPIEASYAGFLGDATFLEGSAMTVSHPWAATLLLLVPALGVWWGTSRRASTRTFRYGGGLAVAGWIAVALWPVPVSSSPWRGGNFVLGLLDVTGESELAGDGGARRVEAPDLGGDPLFPLGPKRHNVLIVMLEGVSGAHLPSLAKAYGFGSVGMMPELERLSAQGLSVPGFIAQQRQTNRGEYAVLCGDYPKLVPGTARMSEYVQEGGVACLPGVLRDAGYATAYLQSAPLSFMLKDQFMPKAGFERVHGAESFRDGYAKNGWGIDDLAFFEHSVDILAELDRGERPWFATLLTVGTHHPFLVPKDWDDGAKGTPHERSLRYADAAVAKLLQRLESAGLLDDTLVIFTSDESSGIERADDGFSRNLSDNWGLFVALVPEEAARGLVQDQVFAQSDIAISVLDYLGEPGRAASFGGRSVFRHYATPRTMWFGNVYVHKVYELGSDATLVACNEDLEQCRQYALEHLHPMAAREKTGEPSPERIFRLRQAVAASLAPRGSTHGVTTLELLPLGAREIPITHTKATHIVFGGQHLTLSPGRTLRCELEVEVQGSGAVVEVNHDLAARDRNVLVQRPIGALESGDQIELVYEFVAGHDLSQVEANLWARKLAGKQAKLLVKRARLTLSDSPAPPKDETTFETYAIRRRGTGRELGLKNLAANACAKMDGDRAIATKCGEKAVIFGPYVFAPLDGVVEARFDVTGVTGSGRLFVDIVSDKGKTVHHDGKAVRMGEGEHVVVETKWKMRKSGHDMEARLRWNPDGEHGSFVVEDASVTVEYPPNP